MAIEFENEAQRLRKLAERFQKDYPRFAQQLEFDARRHEREALIARANGMPETFFELEGIPGHREKVTVGTITWDQLNAYFWEQDVAATPEALALIKGETFHLSPRVEDMELMRFRAGDLGFSKRQLMEGIDTGDISNRARNLSLEVVPEDLALYYALAFGVQNGDVAFGMKPLPNRQGRPSVLTLRRNSRNEVLLVTSLASDKWFPDSQFIFRYPVSHAAHSVGNAA